MRSSVIKEINYMYCSLMIKDDKLCAVLHVLKREINKMRCSVEINNMTVQFSLVMYNTYKINTFIR